MVRRFAWSAFVLAVVFALAASWTSGDVSERLASSTGVFLFTALILGVISLDDRPR